MKYSIAIPILLSIVGALLSISETGYLIVIGWLCFLGLIYFLVSNQQGSLIWKFISVAGGWLIFVGSRALITGGHGFIGNDYSFELESSLIPIIIGVITIYSGIALHRKRQKSLGIVAIVCVLFLVSAVQSINQFQVPITNLPLSQYFRVAIWIAIISLLVYSSKHKIESNSNL